NAATRRAILATGIGLLCLCHSAFAQEPIKIIYPYPAGGSGDAVGRIIADQLQKSLGRSVVVENKTGAGGRIGVQAVKDATPDGNTVLFTATGPMTFVPHLIANLAYDPFTDFVPLSEVATTEIALAVSGHLPVRSLAELASWLKVNPESMIFA